jgi:hypothetical protein
VLVEDSGLDSFWRGFVTACSSSEAIAESIEAETNRLVSFVYDLPRLSGMHFSFPGVVSTLVEHARAVLTCNRSCFLRRKEQRRQQQEQPSSQQQQGYPPNSEPQQRCRSH